MNKLLRKYLESIGLRADASDDDARRFMEALTGAEAEMAQEIAAQAQELASRAESTTEPPADNTGTSNGQASAFDAEAIRAQAAREERSRVQEIRGIAAAHGLGDEWASAQILAGTGVDLVRQNALQQIAQSRQPLRVSVGNDQNRASLAPAIMDAIQTRAGVTLCEFDADGMPVRDAQGRLRPREAHGRAREFRRPLAEIARAYLGAIGVPGVQLMSTTEIVGLAMNPRRLRDQYGVSGFDGGAMATAGLMPGDFTSILGTTVNRSLRQAYMETPSTWQMWARRATAPDFRSIQRLALSESPDLVQIGNGGEYAQVKLTESKETYYLYDYGNLIVLGRRAIINDDLDAFGRIPMLQGQAARRKEDDVAYVPIMSNQTMTEDNTALFIAGHGNLAGSSAALSVTSLAAAVGAMKKQKGIGSKARLALRPSFLLVPPDIEAVAWQLINSIVDPAKNNAAVNPYGPGGANSLQVICEPRLSDTALTGYSVTAWYLAASPNQIDTVEVCFLESEPAPTLEQEVDFDTDGVKFKVRHTVAARAIDYRGLYKNAGA